MNRSYRGTTAWSLAMLQRTLIATLVATALIATACAPFVSTSGEGAIQIFFGTPTGSRALSDPPFTELPVFSAITIKVSGSGMEPVEFTVDATQTSFTAMVPGGSNRRVELYAPVDWDATVAAYSEYISLMPTLVKAYGATTTIDVVPGQRVSAVLKLEVAETKILLPDVVAGTVTSVGDLAAVPDVPTDYTNAGLSQSSDYEFDKYGRLYVTGNNVVRYSYLGDPSPDSSIVGWATSLAMDKQRNRLYMIGDGSLAFADLSSAPPVIVSIALPNGYYLGSNGLAVDGDGSVYVDGYDPSDSPSIIKLSIGSPVGSNAISVVLSSIVLESLHLTYFEAGYQYPFSIQDMTVTDSILYVLASDMNAPSGGPSSGFDTSSKSRGKLVAISCASLSFVFELGWSGDANRFPANPQTQFFGPRRFVAVAPRKLIILDDGFTVGVIPYYPYVDQDRVIEIDLDDQSVVAIGQDGVTDYIKYSSFYAY